MANVNLMKGGGARYNLNSLAKNDVYPQYPSSPPERIAGEYMHGFFTAGNSFNPLFSIGQAEALGKAQPGVGDFIELFTIPECHVLLDVAVKTVPYQSERGYPATQNSDGLSFEYEVRRYNGSTHAELGKVALVTEMSGIMANEFSFKRSAVLPDQNGYVIPMGEYLILGLKVTSLPTDANVRLSDVTCRVEVSGHALDFEVPIHV